jgi:hypothetical protein
MDARTSLTRAGAGDKPKRPRGRQRGSRNREPHKPRPGARHDLVSLGDNTGAARFFRKMVKDIESDLGGRRFLSRIEGELIRAFAGAATMLQYQNVQIALGESGEIDFAGYAALSSILIRVSSRLGLRRRSVEVPSLEEYLTNLKGRNGDGAQEVLEGEVNDDADSEF